MIRTVTVLSLLLFLDEVIIRLVTAWGAVQKCTLTILTIKSQLTREIYLTIFICLIIFTGQISTSYICECTDGYNVVGIRSQACDNKSCVPCT